MAVDLGHAEGLNPVLAGRLRGGIRVVVFELDGVSKIAARLRRCSKRVNLAYTANLEIATLRPCMRRGTK